MRRFVIPILAASLILVAAVPADASGAPSSSPPIPMAYKYFVPPNPAAVVEIVQHAPQPNPYADQAGTSPLAVVGQNQCLLGSRSNGMIYAAKYLSINGVLGYVPYVRDLYPCTGSLGFYPSDSFVNGANIQGSGLVQVGYYKTDTQPLAFWYTPQDSCGGCFTVWPDPGFYPRVGDYVRFSITPSGGRWTIDIWDTTSGHEESTSVAQSFTSGFAWWAVETDNTSTVLDVPVGYPYAWVYNWLYSLNGGSTWTSPGSLSAQLNNPNDAAFYHGGSAAYNGVWGLYGYTTAH